MMDIYAKMEMIIKRVLHFHQMKMGFLFSQKEIVELPNGGKFLCWKTGNILGFDLNVKQVGFGLLEVTIGNWRTTNQMKISLL